MVAKPQCEAELLRDQEEETELHSISATPTSAALNTVSLVFAPASHQTTAMAAATNIRTCILTNSGFTTYTASIVNNTAHVTSPAKHGGVVADPGYTSILSTT
jgi:hypothetical protein